MNKSQTTPWIVGTALIAIVVLAITWFLAISPQLDEAATAREQTEQEVERHDLLEIQIAQLARDFANIDDHKATLVTLQSKIPATLDQAAFNREVASLAESTGAFVTAISASTSMAVAGLATDVPGAAGVNAPAAPAGLYAIPMTITILGNPDQTLSYLSALQTTTSRLFLVSGVALAGQEEAGAAGGKPATANGDAEITISGYTYVLTDAPVVVVDPAAPAAEATTQTN